MGRAALTDKEKIVLLGYAHTDIVSDHGWWSESASNWSDNVCWQIGGIDPVSFPGVVASLVSKNLMSTNRKVMALTDKGRRTLAALYRSEPNQFSRLASPALETIADL